MRCTECDGEFEDAFRFCPWCAAPQRSKIVEYFRGHPLIETEPVGLRVSRYMGSNRHVRLSIWNEQGAVAALALEEREAKRLGAFLGASVERRHTRSRRDRVRERVEAFASGLRGTYIDTR